MTITWTTTEQPPPERVEWTLQAVRLQDGRCLLARDADASDLLAAGYVPAGERDAAKRDVKTLESSNAKLASGCQSFRAERDSLRSDLARVTKERDEARAMRNACYGTEQKWQRVVEAAKVFVKGARKDMPPAMFRARTADYILPLVDAVDALAVDAGPTVAEAEADAACDAVDKMTDEELIAAAEARGVDVEGQAKRMREMLLETARKTMAAKDRLMADPTLYRAKPPPDPNERETLGRLVSGHFGGLGGLSWDELSQRTRDDYCAVGSAVAEYVRRVDGSRGGAK